MRPEVGPDDSHEIPTAELRESGGWVRVQHIAPTAGLRESGGWANLLTSLCVCLAIVRSLHDFVLGRQLKCQGTTSGFKT